MFYYCQTICIIHKTSPKRCCVYAKRKQNNIFEHLSRPTEKAAVTAASRFAPCG